jgi:signal transduction histidine kinase
MNGASVVRADEEQKMSQSHTKPFADRFDINNVQRMATPSGSDPREAIFGVVHDLGNLIQIATSALNIISRSPDMNRVSSFEPVVANASASLHRAGMLVRETMRLARDGQATIEPVDVWVCLIEIEALVRTTWDRNIEFELYGSQALPVLNCNRVGLQSALMNLLLNARDAMPDGGVISLVATAVDNEHAATEVELRISDNGLGMTKEVLRHATDPYFTTKVSGLGGLGLPMVFRFAQEAGGRLQLESEPGRGTVATLRLPIERGNATIDVDALRAT